MKFCAAAVKWDSVRGEIFFADAHISHKGKKFEVSGQRRVLFDGDVLYLCKVEIKTGKHVEETFKMMVIQDSDLKFFKPDNVQIVGKRVKGKFLMEKDFSESLRIVSSGTIGKISLSANEPIKSS